MVDSCIRVSCGVGNLVSYLARINSYKKIENIDNVCVWVAGGYKDMVDRMIEIGQGCVESKLIFDINRNKLNIPRMDDWQPDHASLRYPIRVPFEFPVLENDKIPLPWGTKKVCGIQCKTSLGNPSGFEPSRHLEVGKWIEIIKELKQQGYYVVNFGENTHVPNEYIDLDLWGLPIRQITYLIQQCSLFVGNTSWMAIVTAYAGIPTIDLLYTNLHWLKLHFDVETLPHCGIPNLYIETQRNVKDIIDGIKIITK